MKSLILLSFLCCGIFVNAQYLAISDPASGKPYLETRSDKFKGSPLLFENWQSATVTDHKNNVFKNMLVNVDAVNHSALFKNEKGVFYFQDVIKEINIEGTAGNRYVLSQVIHPELPNGYAQLLSNAPIVVKLERKEKKLISDYNVAGTITEFSDAPVFYFIEKGIPTKIKLGNKDAQKVFSKKWDKTLDFAERNNLSFKEESTWIRVLKAYPEW